MTSEITIQNKLKYIFSNNIIHNIDKRFFFDIGNGHINNNKGIIKYLGRYLARAPIAEYKISSISHDSVSFF